MDLLECPLDFLDCVCLDYIADLDVIVTCNVETAVHAHVNLLDIVLESLEGAEFASIDHDTVADYADFRAAGEFALAYDTSCDGADLGYLEGLLNFGSCGDNLLLLRLEHTLDTALEFVDTVVDD